MSSFVGCNRRSTPHSPAVADPVNSQLNGEDLGTISGGGGYLEEWGSKFLARVGSGLAGAIRSAPLEISTLPTVEGWTPERLAIVVETAEPRFDLKKERDGRILQMDYDVARTTIMALYEFFVLYGDKNPDFRYSFEDVQGLSTKLLHEAAHLWGFNEEAAAVFAKNYLKAINRDLVFCEFEPMRGDSKYSGGGEPSQIGIEKSRLFSVVAHLSYPGPQENPVFSNFFFVFGTPNEFNDRLSSKIEKVFNDGIIQNSQTFKRLDSVWGLRFEQIGENPDIPIKIFIVNFDGTASLLLDSGFSGVAQKGKCGFHYPRNFSQSRTVTYRSHIAPLLQNKCVECHQKSTLYLSDLSDYSIVLASKNAIKESVISRKMPPGPVGDGSCQTFKDSLSLDNDQISQIVSWIDSGTVEGDVLIPLPNKPNLLKLGYEANVQINLMSPFLARANDVRCFSNDLVVDTSKFYNPLNSSFAYLSAFEFTPDNTEIIQSVKLWMTSAAASIVSPTILGFESLDTQPGWDCSQGIGITDLILVGTWSPQGGRLGTTRFPSGTGLKIPLDSKLIMEVKYLIKSPSITVIDPGTTYRAKLENSASGVLEGSWLKISNNPFTLAPMQNPVDLSLLTTLGQSLQISPASPELRGKVYGALPNMHSLGKKLSLRRKSTPSSPIESCFLNFENWNQQSHAFHFYTDKIDISTLDLMHLQCTFDTSQKTSSTSSGPAVNQEECEVLFFITASP